MIGVPCPRTLGSFELDLVLPVLFCPLVPAFLVCAIASGVRPSAISLKVQGTLEIPIHARVHGDARDYWTIRLQILRYSIVLVIRFMPLLRHVRGRGSRYAIGSSARLRMPSLEYLLLVHCLGKQREHSETIRYAQSEQQTSQEASLHAARND